MRKTLFCSALTALALDSPPLAQEPDEAPICTDRPTKASAVCTVPVGNWQLERSAIA